MAASSKLHRALALCLIAALLACPLPRAALADNLSFDDVDEVRQQWGYSVIGTVTILSNDNRSTRVCPSPQACDNTDLLVGLVNPDEEYDCVSVTSTGWYQIVYPAGTTGYVCPDRGSICYGYLSDSSLSYPIGQLYISHRNNVNVYNHPNRKYDKQGAALKGHTYDIVGKASNGWYAFVFNTWIAYIDPDYMTVTSWGAPKTSGGSSSGSSLFGSSSGSSSGSGSLTLITSNTFTLTWVWNDDNDRLGKRPGSVEIALLSPGTSDEIGSRKTLSASNGWQCSWTVKDKTLHYDVGLAQHISGYTFTIEYTGGGAIVTATNSAGSKING